MVYVHFRSRAGLLTAMARDHDRRSGFAARVAAARELPPAEGLERLLREWLAYVPEILPVARALEAAAITGEAGGDAWRDRMDDLHAVFRAAVERVELARPGWTVDDRHRLGVGARASPAASSSSWSSAAGPRRTTPTACMRSILAEIVRPAP